jgi:hypothetical protein
MTPFGRGERDDSPGDDPGLHPASERRVVERT